MTKKEAYKQLLSWYHNQLISHEFCNMEDVDFEVCEALKIEIPENIKKFAPPKNK